MRRSTELDDILGAANEGRDIRDIGVLAARAALQDALGPHLKDFDVGPQVILIQVPSREWSDPVLQAWRTFAKAGRKTCRPGNCETPPSARDWISLVQESRGTISEEICGVAISMGVQLVVVVHNTSAMQPLLAALAELSNSVQYFPGNSVQNFPVHAGIFGCFLLCLKRKESFPVSRMSQ